METWLRFVGVIEISSIVVEKTLFGPESDIESRTKAKQQAATLAAEF
jgi:FMN-dependent NADH-azoreductase